MSGAAEAKALAKYLRQVDRKLKAGIKPLAGKSAQRIKVMAIANLAGTRSNYRLLAAMSYDLTNGGMGAEIGPDQSISGLGLGREFGSSNTPPHPFLFPAADVEEPKFLDAVENAVAKAYTL